MTAKTTLNKKQKCTVDHITSIIKPTTIVVKMVKSLALIRNVGRM